MGESATPLAGEVSKDFGTDADSLDLADGASIVAADRSFSESTRVTAQVFEIDLATSLGELSPWSSAYLVSTREDVDLAAPVDVGV